MQNHEKGVVSKTVHQARSIKRAQEAALKVLESSPDLIKEIPHDSILKQAIKLPVSPDNLRVNFENQMKEPSSDISRISRISRIVKEPKNPHESHVKCHQRYQELETKYRKLEEDFLLLQTQERSKEERYIKREHKFRKIIKDLENELNSYSAKNGDKKMQDISNLHISVIGTIDNFQATTSKMLGKQGRDIIKLFEAKVDELKQSYENEKQKFKKDFKQYGEKEENLIAEIEWVKDTALRIDKENQNLLRKYRELKASQSTSDNEQRLLGEVMKYKRENIVLQTHLAEYEKIIEQFSKEKDIRFSSHQVEDIQQKKLKLSMNPSEPSLHTISFDSANGKTADVSPVQAIRFLHRQRSIISNNQSQVNRNSSLLLKSSDTRVDGVVNKLKGILQREKKQKQQLKKAYIQEVGMKSELDSTLKECIEEVQTSISKMKKERSAQNLRTSVKNDEEERNLLIAKLTNSEKILSLIYNKTMDKKMSFDKLPRILVETAASDEEN